MQVRQMKRAAKREQWKQRITECRSSGIPVKEWCAQHGVCPSTYYRYEQELLRDVQEANAQLALEVRPLPLPVSFVEVPGESRAKSKEAPGDAISISVSAPGFRLKITGETAARALKEIERVLRNA